MNWRMVLMCAVTAAFSVTASYAIIDSRLGGYKRAIDDDGVPALEGRVADLERGLGKLDTKVVDSGAKLLMVVDKLEEQIKFIGRKVGLE